MQEPLKGLCGQQKNALRIGNEDRLLGDTDLRADLGKLRLGDEHTDRAKLLDDVRDGFADQSGRGQIRGGPGIGCAFDT